MDFQEYLDYNPFIITAKFKITSISDYDTNRPDPQQCYVDDIELEYKINNPELINCEINKTYKAILSFDNISEEHGESIIIKDLEVDVAIILCENKMSYRINNLDDIIKNQILNNMKVMDKYPRINKSYLQRLEDAW